MTLRRALIASLFVHLVLFSLWMGAPAPAGTPGQANGMLAALVRQAVSRPAPPEMASAREAVATRPLPVRHAAPVIAQSGAASIAASPAVAEVASSASESRQAVEAPVPEPTREVLSAEGLRQYSISLAREARRHRQYPALARARGWEGTVELRIEISPGVRPAVELTRSSGYEVLDAQALEMMGRAVLATVLPSSLQGRRFTVPVPVRFALDD